MSLPHFFLDEQIIAQESAPEFALRLSGDDMKHAKVLRLKPGEHIAVVDAAQDYFECEIAGYEDDEMIVRVASHGDGGEDPESKCHVILFQGIAKGDKMDSVIRQVTELGIHAVVPLACERSVVKLNDEKAHKRTARWQFIAKSAAMQSGRRYVPAVMDPQDVKQAAGMSAAAQAVVICWEESDGTCGIGAAIRSALEDGDAAGGASGAPDENWVAVIVGPEGGLTEAEVSAFRDCNPHAAVASMGNTILRTETAGVVASALALYELGGLGNSGAFGNTGARCV